MMVGLTSRPRVIWISQTLQDLVEINRIEVPAIHPDIAALGIARQVAMAVPIQMDGAVMRAIPDAQRIMAKHQEDPARMVLDVPQLLDRLPACGILQSLLMIDEPAQVRIVVGECEVTQIVDGVGIFNALVVALDDDVVHLLDAGERPLGELDDVRVAKVLVGCEPDLNGNFRMPCGRAMSARGPGELKQKQREPKKDGRCSIRASALAE
jgi:hypothetical protein